MTDDSTPAATDDGQPNVEHAALAADAAAANGQPAPAPALPTAPAGLAPAADERPELAVGAAFAGGLVLALLLKRLAR